MRSRVLVLVFIFAFLSLAFPTGSRAQQPEPGLTGAPPVVSSADPAADPASFLGDPAAVAPELKLDESLRALVHAGDPDSAGLVIVESLGDVDFEPFGEVLHRFTWPAGEHVAVVRTTARRILKMAAAPGVYQVSSGQVDVAGVADVPSSLRPGEAPVVDAPSLRDRLRRAPAWAPTFGDPAGDAAGALGLPGVDGEATNALRPEREQRTQGWYDVLRGHAAREAWGLGARGAGVRVGVLDYPVDFAHPDMQGTWAVLPPGHPYAGWPQAFDPFAVYVGMLQRSTGTPYNQRGSSGWVDMYQTSAVMVNDAIGRKVSTACFRPLVPTSLGGVTLKPEYCDYIVPPTSKGGQVRFGHHPDTRLTPMGVKPELAPDGEYAGILLVDETTAGTYDTVYVDLDGDRDFTDEKPVSRSSPISWRDADWDRLPDVSGGLLFWIADGVNPFPGAWTWGIEDQIPPAGSAVAILFSTGDHGTLCASNIVAQGRLGVPPDRVFRFRDLPDGEPPATNYGLAPDAGLVSIGNALAAVNNVSMGESSRRYAIFGHDPTRTDDDIQVTSHSYGFSGSDNDGWDPESRWVDHYVRKYSPTTSFLWATGNGGPGYGTVTSPKPAIAVGVGSSTQQGSTGTDSITDTTQITFGDIVPFSNRGPGAEGRIGVHVAADGADGMGAEPLNFVGNGVYANVPWGGTSRSTPVAAGAMALVYDAFRQRHGRWPTWEESRAILMAGSRDAANDVFTMGAGVIDAADSVRIAKGIHGLYSTPTDWSAGGYEGASHAAFTNIISPGEASTTAFRLSNPSPRPLDVTVGAYELRRIGSYTGTLTTDVDRESAFTRAPDYLVPIDRTRIPTDTVLMVVRGAFPMSKFDPNGDFVADQLFTFGVVQHTDINGDGQLWIDRDRNGAVDHTVVTDSRVLIDGTTGPDADVTSVNGSITAPIPPEGVEARMAYYGRGCAGDVGGQPVQGKIALIQRGVCPFVDKVRGAQTAGAVGVVMINDNRKLISMGGTGFTASIPGVMIAKRTGEALRDRLVRNEVITATIRARHVRTEGLGTNGLQPFDAAASEIQPYEYMRMAYDYATHNHWAVSVHHPLERWSNGLYVALWHSIQPTSAALVRTDVQLQVDFYAYRPWQAVAVEPATLTIPAGGASTVTATMWITPTTPYGMREGAIFADYARAPGDQPLVPPGGYEAPYRRTVIPVNANVSPRYGWRGTVSLGGPEGREPDALYDNGAMFGTYNWQWRPESGDWRFLFVDAQQPPAGTHWLVRTTWDEADPEGADIDTRVYGPYDDPFSNPAHLDNQGEEDVSDPSWFGPYTLGLVTRSPYLVQSSNQQAPSSWPFDTSSGGHEDWLTWPASRGLFEVMLHNVLFSGNRLAMPFETRVGSLRFNPPQGSLFGNECGSIEVTSAIELSGVRLRAYGMTKPTVLLDQPIAQENPDDINTSAFRRDVQLSAEAGMLAATLSGEPDDDLDVFILRDNNGDGRFTYPDEVVAQSAGQTSQEYAQLPGAARAGRYQVWVHGWSVKGANSTFDLTIDVVSGEQLRVQNPPARLEANVPTRVGLCIDAAALAGQQPPLSGVLTLGWKGTAALVRAPVRWTIATRHIFLPSTVKSAEVKQPVDKAPTPEGPTGEPPTGEPPTPAPPTTVAP